VKRHQLSLRAFPRDWRERYGAELLELLVEGPHRRWAAVDLLRVGLTERGRRAWQRAAPSSPRRVTRAGFALAPLVAVAIALAAVLQGGGLNGASQAFLPTSPGSTARSTSAHDRTMKRRATTLAGEARHLTTTAARKDRGERASAVGHTAVGASAVRTTGPPARRSIST
jgi:hypothetical protein